MNFEDVDRRYTELKHQLDKGTVRDKEFDAQLKQMMIRDNEGRWWAKSRKTGEWHYKNGAQWIRADPYGASGNYTPDLENLAQTGTTEDVPPEQERTAFDAQGGQGEQHSRMGVASFVLSVPFVFLYLWGYVTTLSHGFGNIVTSIYGSWFQPGLAPQGLFFWPASLASLISFGLAIAELLQRRRKKRFAVLGVLLSALSMVWVVWVVWVAEALFA